MGKPLKIGVIGDFNPSLISHVPTNESLNHAASALSVNLDYSWIPTQAVDHESTQTVLNQFHGLWCGPGSPYRSMDGALRSIQFAREKRRPFFGT